MRCTWVLSGMTVPATNDRAEVCRVLGQDMNLRRKSPLELSANSRSLSQPEPRSMWNCGMTVRWRDAMVMGNDSVLVAAPCEVDDSKSSSQGNKITGSSSEKNTTTTISSPPTKSILFESRDKALVLIDVPRSLEESQVLAAETPRRRIVSVEPPATPYATPEPRHGARNSHQAASLSSPGAQLAELMTTAAVQGALQDLVSSYPGPFHLARFLGPPHPPLISGLPAHLPPKAEPLQGSIQQLRESFDASAPNFDLVVLDPPWPNRSARRRTDKYATARNLNEMRELLLQIPLASHLSPDSLVAVWVTNKHSIHDFLASPTGLFAAWGLEVVTEWTWVKVTTTGEPLFDVESTWRKPWEKLIIAKRVGHKRPDALKPKVIVAVPDVHSRKPNLRGLFQDILGESFLGLEVFARNLTAGWWGWGDQVLHFQQVEHWSSEDDV